MGLKENILSSQKDYIISNISSNISSLGLNAEFFCAPYDLPMSYGNLFNKSGKDFPEDGYERFTGLIRTWKSVSKQEMLDYWTLDSCLPVGSVILGENGKSDASLSVMGSALGEVDYLPVLMEDYYEMVEDIQCTHMPNAIGSVRSDTNTLQYIAEHKSVIHIFDNVNLFYIRMKHPIEQVDTKQFARDRWLAYPYCSSPTTHELFKLLLEWQWSKQNLDCTEPVAIAADNFLQVLGMNVSDSENQVVQSLLDLPDQQVFQYLKNGSISTVEDEVSRPDEFTNWFTLFSQTLTSIKELNLAQ